MKFLAPLQEGLLTKARHVLPSHPDPGQVLVVLKSQRKELKEASSDCSRRRGSGDASVRPHECRGSQEELLSSSANQAPGAGRGQVLAPMSLSPRATGEQQSLRGGSGGCSSPPSIGLALCRVVGEEQIIAGKTKTPGIAA